MRGRIPILNDIKILISEMEPRHGEWKERKEMRFILRTVKAHQIRDKKLADKLSLLRIFIDGTKYRGGVETLNDVIAELEAEEKPE